MPVRPVGWRCLGWIGESVIEEAQRAVEEQERAGEWGPMRRRAR
ncbi:hypothetical protein [Streptomyces sp. MAI_2237]